MNDFRSDGEAGGKEEIFNQCHARLRNVIERAFGVVKACFPLLKRMTPYSFTTQTKFIMTCFSIHNFLRQISVADRLFSEYDNEVELESGNANQNQNSTTSSFFAASDQESCNSSETKSQMNSFKCLVNLSFLAFYHCKKCNV